MYPLKFTGIFEGCLYKDVPSKTLRQRKTQCFQWFFAPCSSYEFAADKTPWIAKKVLDDNKVPVLPYTRYNGKSDRYKPWEYIYDVATDEYICPQGSRLRHTTTDRNGKRTYRSIPQQCVNCPCKAKCGANEKGQKIHTTHIWI